MSSTTPWPPLVTLTGETVELVPLSPDHEPGLIEAVRDGDLWKLWTTTIPAPEDVAAEIERRLGLHAKGSMTPFAVIERATRTVVGMTTYMNVDAVNRRVEIGSTFYAKSVQRTALNTECKLLLLSHAFEELDCIAVEFRTHFFNQQSRRAIERLGAKQDGILRNHSIDRFGNLRDTVVYSILDSEWATVRKGLQARLGR